MEGSTRTAQLPSQSDLTKLDTPALIEQSREVWDIVKDGITDPQHRVAFAGVLSTMAERLDYAVAGPANARVGERSFT